MALTLDQLPQVSKVADAFDLDVQFRPLRSVGGMTLPADTDANASGCCYYSITGYTCPPECGSNPSGSVPRLCCE